LKPVEQLVEESGIRPEEWIPYGRWKGKIDLAIMRRIGSQPMGKLICVTAMTPTSAGEGKTCVSIGLTEALGRLGMQPILCLRQPSMGPALSLKGGGAGAGQAQVFPADEANFHFTGDMHAVGAAHNLLAAMVDHHLGTGNRLELDVERIEWRRVVDLCDRSLREIQVGLEGSARVVPRRTGFDITAASEISAVLALSMTRAELKERLGRIVVGWSRDGRPVTATQLGIVGAMAAVLREAFLPNLVQTIEGQAVLMHTGPFANISHGNNSAIATAMALRLSRVVVTESGFAADLGFEKFCHLVCPVGGFRPDAVVVVASVKALKEHGHGVLRDGWENLTHHVRLVQRFGLPPVVALNRFPDDTEAELQAVLELCRAEQVPAAVVEVVAKGGEGGAALAELVMRAAEAPSSFQRIYEADRPITEKVGRLAREVYGAGEVTYSAEALAAIQRLEELGFGRLPINVAKTRLSVSDDPLRKGAPTGWLMRVREVRLWNGAGYVVVLAGKTTLMPGMPVHPLAERIDVDDEGRLIGTS